MGTHSNREDLSLVMTSYFDPQHTGEFALPEMGSARHRHPEVDPPTIPFRPVASGRHRQVRPPSPGRRETVVKGAAGVVALLAAATVVGMILNHTPVVDDPGLAADVLAAPTSTSASPPRKSQESIAAPQEFLSASVVQPPVVKSTAKPPAPSVTLTTTTTAVPPLPPHDTAPFCDTEATCKAYSEVIVAPTQLGCFQEVVRRESSWNELAEGPPTEFGRAFGLGQALPRSKYATAGPDWATNGATQLRWTLIYMEERYGSPCAALAFHDRRGWY